jgi:hypothetical protein
VGKRTKKENVRNKTKKENKMKQKIIIMGDSNARGMAKELKYRLNQEFEIQGIIKHGSTCDKCPIQIRFSAYLMHKL